MLSYSGITVLSFANKVVKVQPQKFVRSLLWSTKDVTIHINISICQCVLIDNIDIILIYQHHYFWISWIWSKVGLHLNLIICTNWSGSIKNILVSFHLTETIFNCETCLFYKNFLRKLLHSFQGEKVVILLLYSIINCIVRLITFTNDT